MDNFPFYTTLLLVFLDRSFQLNLTSEIGITLLFRVSKVCVLTVATCIIVTKNVNYKLHVPLSFANFDCRHVAFI